MNLQEARLRLKGLLEDGHQRYRLPCRKAFLLARLCGCHNPMRFTARDNVRFRMDERGLTVEALKTGAEVITLAWPLVESVAAGEPETDNGPLFQG
ncbi:MAG: hypothetical protein JO307_26450 [Bryobacterales bacterium]|nr:hypothetical protein [Bryobacterales bacterium]MBV9396995.1 hypothetical protein [Bryobacterales bacterium]